MMKSTCLDRRNPSCLLLPGLFRIISSLNNEYVGFLLIGVLILFLKMEIFLLLFFDSVFVYIGFGIMS